MKKLKILASAALLAALLGFSAPALNADAEAADYDCHELIVIYGPHPDTGEIVLFYCHLTGINYDQTLNPLECEYFCYPSVG